MRDAVNESSSVDQMLRRSDSTGAVSRGGASTLRITALFTAVALVFIGSGLQGSLVSVRGAQEGMSNLEIGIVMSSFYAGVVGGSIFAPGLIQSVGHIRAFAAFASLASAAALAFTFLPSAVLWALLRAAAGACHAGLLIVAESWINAGAVPSNRGRMLALYGVISYAAWAASQPLLAVAPAQSFTLFAVISILLSMALVPVTLTRGRAPGDFRADRASLRRLMAISPTAVLGVFLFGMSTGAFWGLAPNFAERVGLSEAQISLFLTAPLVGALALQWPLGWASDVVERRLIIALSAGFAGLAALGLAFEGGFWPLPRLLLALTFGAFAMPLYAICIAHANDRIDASELVAAASGLVLVYGAGATLGPFTASLAMRSFEPPALFIFIATSLFAISLTALVRRATRPPHPKGEKEHFVSAPTTSHAALAMHPQGESARSKSAAPG